MITCLCCGLPLQLRDLRHCLAPPRRLSYYNLRGDLCEFHGRRFCTRCVTLYSGEPVRPRRPSIPTNGTAPIEKGADPSSTEERPQPHPL